MTVQAGIVNNNGLVDEEVWKEYIAGLATASADAIQDKHKGKASLRKELIASVKRRLPDSRFGILFSGGVDSTVIAVVCKNLGKEYVCYSVGMAGSKDISSASDVADEMGFPLKKAILNLDEVGKLLNQILKIIPLKDIVNIEVGITSLAAINLAKLNNDFVLFSGLGAEEIFAGYRRHAEAEDVNAECWNGLKNMWEADLQRDFAIANAANVKLLTPFLDTELIKTAMQVPGEWKINGVCKKIILREVAADLCVPEKFAYRKKLAAQYGSSISKGIEKLAKRNGFKYKKDYIASILK